MTNLAEIKATRASVIGYPDMRAAEEDIDWLVGEVERLQEQESLTIELGDLLPQKILTIDRLRGLLARLEWAGEATPGTRIGTVPRCPVCRETKPPHDRGCWLAAELYGTTKAAPADRGTGPVDQGRDPAPHGGGRGARTDGT